MIYFINIFNSLKNNLTTQTINIAYKLLQEILEGETIGPILVGLKKSIHVVQMGASVREIVNMVKVAVVDAQNK